MKDFGMQDFLKPTPERTRIALSTFINYLKFYDGCAAVYTSAYEEKEKSQKLKEEEMAVLIGLQAKEQHMKEQYERERPQIDKVQSEIDALEQEVEALKQRRFDAEDRVRSMTNKANELSTLANSTNKPMIAKLEAEIRALRSQIVTSPDKLKQEVADKLVEVEQRKAMLSASEQEIRNLDVRVQTVSHVERRLACRVEEIHECKALMHKLYDVVRESNGTQSDIDAAIADKEDAMQQLERAQQRGAACEKRLVAMSKDFHQQERAALRAIKDLRDNEQLAKAEVERTKLEAVNSDDVVRQRQKEMETVKAEHAEQMRRYKKKVKLLEQQLEGWHTRLTHAMRSVGSVARVV